MPFNGSGTYSAPSSPGAFNPAITGSLADPSDWNSLLADLATALSTVICRDGQSAVTADIPMGGNKITGLANGTASTDAAAFGQLSGIIATGIMADYVGTTPPSGWILAYGTIGDASSGATNRANADTSALFTLLWNSMANAQAPVSGGRGANAAADFAAHKTIGVPDLRGRARWGRDNMGGVSANVLTIVASNTLGFAFGDQNHTHTVSSTGTGSGSTVGTGVTSQPSATVFGYGAGGVEGVTTTHTHDMPSVAVSVTSVSVSGTSANQNTFPAPGIALNVIIKL